MTVLKTVFRISKRKTVYAVGATALALSALAGAAPPISAAAPPAKTDAALTQRLADGAGGGVSAIVRVDGPLTPAREAQLAALGARVTARLPIIGSAAVTLPARRLPALAALPFVTHLSYDGAVKKCDEFTTGSSGAGQASQQYGLTGDGVGVAVLDSGVRSGADLGGDRVTGVSLIPGNTNPDDQCGHGTHVAGIIAGSGAQSTGSQYTHSYYGIARKAHIVSVRVLDAQGGGTVSTVVAGLQWVVSNQAKYGIKVVNLSLGHPVGESYTTDPLCQAAEAAWRAGIVVVCAAGNEGRANAAQTAGAANEGWGTAYGSIQSPGNDPFVLTVGATKSTDGSRADDKIATYSSRGPSRLDLICKPDLVAPGNKVISVLSNGTTLFNSNAATGTGLPTAAYMRYPWNGCSPDYFVLSGTSMAAPVVAGAAALMLQKYPTLSPDTVKARLMLSADKPAAWCAADGSYDPCTYGAGYLNIPAALGSAFTVSGEYAVSPSLSVSAGGSVGVNDDHCLWGKTSVYNSHCLWGKSCLWGASGVSDLSALWGSHCLWGKSTLAASGAISASSVWGDHSLWGASTDAVDLSSVVRNGE